MADRQHAGDLRWPPARRRAAPGTTAARSWPTRTSGSACARLGAKVDSLAHCAAGREWLITRRAELPDRHVYGSTLTDATLCGWDEMLPTADP